MGAATYEETLEEEDDSLMKSRRVQRKLTEPEHTDKDLDPEQLEYTEYQGIFYKLFLIILCLFKKSKEINQLLLDY
ncbi:hypothetical protein O3M35_000443 [Rhynocoris fuscipes]|uniref:Uncharacterized protein n=1 Tax=Rhynocoris fuscipes TaxID=488301 RepID=A0AAW1DQ67_9HEMI